MLGTLAPTYVSAQSSESLRGMYINGFTLFEGHNRAEQEFVDFVRDNKITYVVFYIRPFEVPSYGPELSDLINTLKSEAGVLQVGATTGGGSQVIVDHNNQHSGKFDVINLENEFWGAPQDTPERVESFAGFTGALDEMNNLAAGNNLKVEAYIGWPTRAEMAEIVTRLDRLLIHAYVPTPERTYPTLRTRFEWISELNSDVEVMPIYSLEKTENNRVDGPVFMGQWMLDNSPDRSDHDFVEGFDRLESIFEADYNEAVSGSTNLDINWVGHHYFVYSEIVNLPPTASIDTPTLNHIVVEGGASTPIEFAMSGSDRNLRGVEWYQGGIGHIGSAHFNGETTNSRTITAVPPYSVAAVPFDSGLYGRPALYARDAVSWQVLAQNTLPTATAVLPVNLEVFLEPGDTQTFIHEAKDIDGNLFATDWYGKNEYLRRTIISGTEATTSREIQFDEAGTFIVSVDLFDRAVYMPDNEIRQNKIGGSVQWTVHVGSPLQPVAPPVIISTASSNTALTQGTGVAETPVTDESARLSSHALYDRDLDGVPAYLDDNEYDAVIGDNNNAIESYFDPDRDGTLSSTLSAEEMRDTDGDLVPDNIEVSNGTNPGDSQSFLDFDDDRVPDYVDPDDDNDGIPDFIEGDADIDGDGMPNRFDLDSDGDGSSDAIEGMADVDGNSLPNFVDTATVSPIPDVDQDNDRIADNLEGTADEDQDGTPNLRDNDSDGDLISDLLETNADLDADGIPNFLDGDSDGDSISDLIEGDADNDSNGMPDFLDAAISSNTSVLGNEVSEVNRISSSGGGAIGGRLVDMLLPLFVIITCLMLRRRRVAGLS